jgi:hypothetical protein
MKSTLNILLAVTAAFSISAAQAQTATPSASVVGAAGKVPGKGAGAGGVPGTQNSPAVVAEAGMRAKTVGAAAALAFCPTTVRVRRGTFALLLLALCRLTLPGRLVVDRAPGPAAMVARAPVAPIHGPAQQPR